MPRERILITVKTYPTISTKYKELSCTAGFREDGTWIRLYPVPFRLLENDRRYTKYQWIEADIQKSPADQRPESFRVTDTDRITLLDRVNTDRDWAERRRLVMGSEPVHTNLATLIEKAHKNELSLATFRPAQVLDVTVEDVEANWPDARVAAVLDSFRQGNLFDDTQIDEFKIMPKLPKKFSYTFEDEKGKRSTLMIEDWEIGQLYWNCVKRYGEQAAVEKVRQKYLDDFARTKDLHLFLGTTYQWHVRKAPNPYVVIGTFHPPHEKQGSLF